MHPNTPCGFSPVKITENQAPLGTVDRETQDALQEHWDAARKLGVRHLGGRPTKYHEGMPELAFEILTDERLIASVGHVAMMLGMSRSTLYALQQKHPRLREAVSMGRAFQEARLASILSQGIKNPQGLMLIMVQYHGWKHYPKKKDKQNNQILDLIRNAPGNRLPVDWGKVEQNHSEQFPVGSSGQSVSAPSFSRDPR